MAKVKHNAKAAELIDDAIEKLEPIAQFICKRLHKIILSSDTELIEY